MDLDRQSDIAALDTTLTTVERVLDIDALRSRIAQLEQDAADPNLHGTTRPTPSGSPVSCRTPRANCAGWRACSRLDDLPVLYELAAEEEGRAAPKPSADAGRGAHGASGRHRGDGGPHAAVR